MRTGQVSFSPAAASEDAYARLRSRLPREQLEYAQALGTVALLALALLLIGLLALRSGPRKALSFLLGRLGVKT